MANTILAKYYLRFQLHFLEKKIIFLMHLLYVKSVDPHFTLSLQT